MAENGIASAVTRRIIGAVEATLSGVVADGSRALRYDCQRCCGRLRAGSLHSTGHSGTATERFDSMVVYVDSQRSDRCRAFATTPRATRTSRGGRTCSVAGTGRYHHHQSSLRRRAPAGSSPTRRYYSRYRCGSLMERHDVPPDRNVVRPVHSDGSSKIRSGDCTTARLDAGIGFSRTWSYSVAEPAESFDGCLEPSKVLATYAAKIWTTTTTSGNRAIQ